MPTWTLTPVNGTQTNFNIADYKADAKGNVLNFAISSDAGTSTFHLAPEEEKREVNGVVSKGMEVASDLAGAGAGFKVGQEMVSKLGGTGGGIAGMAGGVVEGLAGAALGAFLAHTAKNAAENLYENGAIEKGDYYNQAGELRFHGLIKVNSDGSQKS